MSSNQAPLVLSHQELNFLIFALEGAPETKDAAADPPSCEEMCPVVGRIEQAFDLGGGNEKEKLARHLKEHLSEALIECGAFEMLRSSGQHQNPARPSSSPDESTVRLINERLANWSCSFRIDESERRLLLESLASLPVSAWLSMPGLLWRLKRKLKKQETA